MNVQTVKNYVSNKIQVKYYENLKVIYNEALGIAGKPFSDQGGGFGSGTTKSSPNSYLLAIANDLTSIEKSCSAYRTLCNDVERFIDWCPSPYKELWRRQYIEGESLTKNQLNSYEGMSNSTLYRKLRYYIDVFNEEAIKMELPALNFQRILDEPRRIEFMTKVEQAREVASGTNAFTHKFVEEE